MSVAHRLGAEGYAVALVSRTATRHADYLRSLADAGVDAAAFTADAADPARLRRASMRCARGSAGSMWATAALPPWVGSSVTSPGSTVTVPKPRCEGCYLPSTSHRC
jgi:NAD(P)-dependent dehydrogenase (short-subunit alcohol dehydrogenase family)